MPFVCVCVCVCVLCVCVLCVCVCVVCVCVLYCCALKKNINMGLEWYGEINDLSNLSDLFF